jgi:hypothetical protein
MRSKQRKPLPKMLPGAVCRQWKRCGKRRCRCANGTLHGPYFYRFWREDGRLRKAYVKPADLAAVQEACAAEREFLRVGRLARALGQQDWRRLVVLIRQVEDKWQTP